MRYAYEYWKHNFENRFYDIFLENELIQHCGLYKENLEEIYIYLEKRVVLQNTLMEYSLDLGFEICQEIDNYCSCLNFSYQTDNWGGYDNYWRCFFEMISSCYDIMDRIKKCG